MPINSATGGSGRSDADKQKAMLPGAFGTMPLNEIEKKALDDSIAAKKALDARSATQNEGYSMTQKLAPEPIVNDTSRADLEAEKAALRQATTPVKVEPKVDAISPPKMEEAKATMDKVVASNPEKAQDPNWLASAWDKVSNFFGSPDAADDATFWDIMEAAGKGYAGNTAPTSREARMARAQELEDQKAEAAQRLAELTSGQSFNSRENALDRAARLEEARLQAAGMAGAGNGVNDFAAMFANFKDPALNPMMPVSAEAQTAATEPGIDWGKAAMGGIDWAKQGLEKAGPAALLAAPLLPIGGAVGAAAALGTASGAKSGWDELMRRINGK